MSSSAYSTVVKLLFRLMSARLLVLMWPAGTTDDVIPMFGQQAVLDTAKRAFCYIFENRTVHKSSNQTH